MKNVSQTSRINKQRRSTDEHFCIIKKTFDTEEKISVSNGQIEDDGAEFIINPYDEYAVEEAIVQRDAHGEKSRL